MIHNGRPKPGEYKEIARGSGPAAILMFLHIAVIGYLAYIAWYLLKYNTDAFWNLFIFSAGLYFYFPAAFAVLTPMPTDPLTKIVGTVARVFGIVAAVICGYGLIHQVGSGSAVVGTKWIVVLSSIAAAVAGALLCRVLFAIGIRGGAGYFAKNE